jgi:hypothetical protein
MFRRIFSFKKCCTCSKEYNSKNATNCPTCNSKLGTINTVDNNLGLSEILGIDNFFNFDAEKKYNNIKKLEIPVEIIDEKENKEIVDKQENDKIVNQLENDEDSGYDTDSEYETESESDEDVIPYDVKDYIINDYEKDLEMAINLSLKDKEFCIICFDNSINAVFIPCGHFCCCHKCAKKCAKKCPICRKKIKLVQKIYK